MKTFPLRIATLQRMVFDRVVDSVTLPGDAGEFTVLASHTPLISPMSLGMVTARFGREEFFMAVSGGMVEVQPHRVLVLADQAEVAEELDEKLVEEARMRAEKLMKEKQQSAENFAAEAAALERALLHLRIIKRHRSKRS